MVEHRDMLNESQPHLQNGEPRDLDDIDTDRAIATIQRYLKEQRQKSRRGIAPRSNEGVSTDMDQ